MPAAPLELFRRLTTGVYVVTASHQDQRGGFTAAWVTQIAFEPLLLAISVNTGNATWPLIESSRRFVINVLGDTQLELARRFGTRSGREEDKLSGVPTTRAERGGVVLTTALAWLDCMVWDFVDAGQDHVLVIARVDGGGVLDATAQPLIYAATGNMDGSAELYPPEFA
jgi:flavin reductase (DIM6/NTAB) family NADH-FMN oxidoreductase RutF